MALTPTYDQQFIARKICVMIPTYNNAGTLGKVIGDVLAYTSHVIVVNDGSTDQTPQILEQYPQVAVVSYAPNAGKVLEGPEMGYPFLRRRIIYFHRRR